jgi:hypothetical protein
VERRRNSHIDKSLCLSSTCPSFCQKLEVEKSGIHAGGEPWPTAATFIYDDQGTKYAVEVRIGHRKVAGKRAFFGLDVTRVAKQ